MSKNKIFLGPYGPRVASDQTIACIRLGKKQNPHPRIPKIPLDNPHSAPNILGPTTKIKILLNSEKICHIFVDL